MILGLHKRESEEDVFLFYLASQLGKSLSEVEEMPYSEITRWRAYYTAKSALENQK